MNDFLLSIIIPTRNRQKYLLKCIDEILTLNDERIQIIIQDNSDIANLLKHLPICKKANQIKYQYTPGIVSFVDNFNFAMESADGTYCCLIGDDDGVTDYIGDVTAWANKYNIEALIPEVLFEYFWPNSIDIKKSSHQGLIRLLDTAINVKIFEPYKHIKKLLYNGGQNYTTLELGKLYHGIIKTSSLKQIKEITGKYFGGLTPDIYMAVALSLTLKSAVKINFPLTIAGVCSNSGSADSSTGRHVGPLESAPHFKGHQNYSWATEVPPFYSVETIWADSALAALYDFHQDKLVKKFSVSNLDAYCKWKYPEYSRIIVSHFNNYQKKCSFFTRIINFYQFITYPTVNLGQKVWRRLCRFNKKLVYADNLPDIIAANNYFNQLCLKKGITKDYLITILNEKLEGKMKNV